MTGPTATLCKNGRQLHMQHGPIDLLIEADGARDMAFDAAQIRFQTLLGELVEDLPQLREPLAPTSQEFRGETTRHMQQACRPFMPIPLTPMICVAGAVADTVLGAMMHANPKRAFVNNGGDIALHLQPGTEFHTAMVRHDGRVLGRIIIRSDHPVRGVATSGWRGRSHSLGIADSVTVLAHNAATADVAATLIANAVNLPDHPMVQRCPANTLSPDSDLGAQLVTVDVPPLPAADIDRALDMGHACAAEMHRKGQIIAAALFLGDAARLVGGQQFFTQTERALTYA